MSKKSEIRKLVSAQPGWYVAEFREEALGDGFDLFPIIAWYILVEDHDKLSSWAHPVTSDGVWLEEMEGQISPVLKAPDGQFLINHGPIKEEDALEYCKKCRENARARRKP